MKEQDIGKVGQRLVSLEARIMSVTITEVRETASELTDDELAALSLCVSENWDPRGRTFNYTDVRHLFTEDDGLKMHQATKEALAIIVDERIG